MSRLLASIPKDRRVLLVAGAMAVVGGVQFQRWRLSRHASLSPTTDAAILADRKRLRRAGVNSDFIHRLWVLLKIAIPGVTSREFFLLTVLMGFCELPPSFGDGNRPVSSSSC